MFELSLIFFDSFLFLSFLFVLLLNFLKIQLDTLLILFFMVAVYLILTKLLFLFDQFISQLNKMNSTLFYSFLRSICFSSL